MALRALCVGRHRFLSEHFGRVFRELGVECVPCVGIAHAADVARACAPDIVICDYDLLATAPLGQWESDATLSRVPVVAVSLSRRSGEAHLLDVNGIAGFLYLPTLTSQDAWKVLGAVERRGPAA